MPAPLASGQARCRRYEKHRAAALAPAGRVASYSARCARVSSPARHRRGTTSESPKQASRSIFSRAFHSPCARLAICPAKPRATVTDPCAHAIACRRPTAYRTGARLHAHTRPGSASHRLRARPARTLFSRRCLWIPPARAHPAASRRSRLSRFGHKMDRQQLWADFLFYAALVRDDRYPGPAHSALGTPPGLAVSAVDSGMGIVAHGLGQGRGRGDGHRDFAGVGFVRGHSEDPAKMVVLVLAGGRAAHHSWRGRRAAGRRAAVFQVYAARQFRAAA